MERQGIIGSATAETLLAQGEAVAVVTRTADKADHLQKLGAEVAVSDVHDVETMRNVFRFGKRLFLLNWRATSYRSLDQNVTSIGFRY